jgi:hypothetical protein
MEVPAPLTTLELDPASISIPNIDAYLTTKYSPTPEEKIEVEGTIIQRRPFDVFSRYVFGNYERLHTSGNKNDCLIHAVLGGVSSVFRRLPTNEKDEFADYFRRTVLPQTYGYKSDQAGITRLKGTEFLEDIDVGIIKDILGISVLSFESAASGREDTAGIATFFIKGQPDIYMIFNPGNYHYETARVNGTSSYTIPIDRASDINKVINENMIQNDYNNIKTVDAFKVFEEYGFNIPDTGRLTDPVAIARQIKLSFGRQIDQAKERLTIFKLDASASASTRLNPAAPIFTPASSTPTDRSSPQPAAPGLDPSRIRQPLDASPFEPSPLWGDNFEGGKKRRRTYRKRKGGNEPVKYTKQTRETIKKDVESAIAKSPGVASTAAKLFSTDIPKSLPKGGRRRTFRKKKIQQIEKQLEAIKKSLTDIIKE